MSMLLQVRELLMRSYRQGSYCNNLKTRVIPLFIVSKPSVSETISKNISFERSFIVDHFLLEDHDLTITQKRNI